MRVVLVGGVVMGAILPLAGCSLTAHPFAGSIVELTITGAQRTAPDQHLELWARTQYDDIVRIDHVYEDPTGRDPNRSRFGFVIRNAIDMGDPCMIDARTGARLTRAEAYPSAVTVEGVTQTPEEQAAAVRARIAQVTSANNCDQATPPHCGQAGQTLLGTVPYSTTVAPLPSLPDDAAPADRLAACQAYWASSPLAYTPNPLQLVAPLHGTITGFVDFTTQVPVAAYNAVRIESSVGLRNLRELFLTIETLAPGEDGDGVDPLHRGPTYLQGTPTLGGRDVQHFDLQGPSASGTAAVLADLDENTNGF